MYDKIRFWVNWTMDSPDVVKTLENAIEHINRETGETYISGYLYGMKIIVNMRGMSITGSLARCLYPNNVYPVDRHTVASAIEKLSDTLCCNIGEAMITELEFGCVYLMSHPVEDYLIRLGTMPRLQRYAFTPYTLYYKSKGKSPSRQYIFYDKKAEAMTSGKVLPERYDKCNMLKYEMRLRGSLHKRLNEPELFASKLSDRTVYSKLMKKYQESYFSISKSSPEIVAGIHNINTVSDAKNVLMARLLYTGGDGLVERYIDELKNNNTFSDRKYYSRLKKELLKLKGEIYPLESDKLIKELDNEINNVGAYI